MVRLAEVTVSRLFTPTGISDLSISRFSARLLIDRFPIPKLISHSFGSLTRFDCTEKLTGLSPPHNAVALKIPERPGLLLKGLLTL